MVILNNYKDIRHVWSLSEGNGRPDRARIGPNAKEDPNEGRSYPKRIR